MTPEQLEQLKSLHARHEERATYYEISSVLKPGKAESLRSEDRIYRKACHICGLVVEYDKAN